jgi:threonine dehydratase
LKQIDSEAHSVTPADIESAAKALRPYLPPTPLQHSRAFTDKARCHVHLKIESIQPIRAFKVRGALHKLIRLPEGERAAGVITASAGNHGLGVAYAAATFKVPATVYVPETANAFKVEAIRRLGARVVVAGRNYGGANTEALSAQQES